jgi:hypothetical protein
LHVGLVFSALIGLAVARHFYRRAREDSNEAVAMLLVKVSELAGREIVGIKYDKKTGKPLDVVYGRSCAVVGIRAEGTGHKIEDENGQG